MSGVAAGLSLVKGTKISLTKENPGLTALTVVMGWPAKAGRDAYDLDASVVLLRGGKFTKQEDLVYFGAKEHPSGAAKCGPDNTTGGGAAETIDVDFSKVEADVDRLVFIANIYEATARNQNFGQINDAFIKVMDGTNELLKFDLSEDYSAFTGIEVCSLYRHDGGWKFEARGTGVTGSLTDIVSKYE